MSSVLGSETDVSAVSGAAAMPEVSSVGVSTPTSSLKPRVFVKNEMVTSSTSVNITGLEHFTEYMMKVSSAAAAADLSDCSDVSGSVRCKLIAAKAYFNLSMLKKNSRHCCLMSAY